jgi:hypothetical protein
MPSLAAIVWEILGKGQYDRQGQRTHLFAVYALRDPSRDAAYYRRRPGRDRSFTLACLPILVLFCQPDLCFVRSQGSSVISRGREGFE